MSWVRPVQCQEEEVAPFFTYAWRVGRGWRPVFLPLRGPGSLWSFYGWFLIPLGIWRFARTPRPFMPEQSRYIGATVRRCDYLLGSYGMGGPGFVGIKFPLGWVVIRLWHAAGLITLNTRLVREAFNGDEGREYEPLESLHSLVGKKLEKVTVGSDELQMVFCGSALSIRRDGRDVPPFRGNGEGKVLDPDVDLGDVLIVSRGGNLWLP